MSRKAIRDVTFEDMRVAKRVYASRPRRSRKIDGRYAGRIPAFFETWLRHPERYDLPGVDYGFRKWGKKRGVRGEVVLTSKDVSLDEPVVNVSYVLSYPDIAKRSFRKRFYGFVVVYEVGDKAVVFVPGKPSSLEGFLRKLGFKYTTDLVGTLLSSKLVGVPKGGDDFAVRLRLGIDLLYGLAHALGIGRDELRKVVGERLEKLEKSRVLSGTPEHYAKVAKLFNAVVALDDVIDERMSKLFGEYSWFKYSATSYKEARHWPTLPLINNEGKLISNTRPMYMYPKGFYRIVNKEKVEQVLKKIVPVVEKFDGVPKESLSR